jgi:hypothetical protein
VCLKALGASADGVCTEAPRGYAGTPACAPLACTGSSAECAECANDSHCQESDYCAADGSCLPRKTVGQACDLGAGADCKVAGCRACRGAQNGYCVDRVCCESVCDAPCEACSQSLGSSTDGQCEPALAPDAGERRCGTGFLCDGTSRACPESCRSDAECAPTHYCSAANKGCEPRIPVGGSCDTSDCAEEGCRVCDGVCLDGQCLAGCSSDMDCPGGLCDAALGACFSRPPPDQKKKGGCDCGIAQSAGSPFEPGSYWLAALLLSRLRRRRWFGRR